MPAASALLRQVPAVDRVLNASADLVESHGRAAVTDTVRFLLDQLRTDIQTGSVVAIPSITSLRAATLAALNVADARSLQAVYNLTGTVLHTNLGRAVLPASIKTQLETILFSPSNVEFDLTTGARGERDDHLEALICELTGAEAATVVNNNAAALMLVLNTLAGDREVPVSRGELVEIGGSFRIPDVMARAGCLIREIGTTNRTHAQDYERAITAETALLLKVHPSNYEISGFTKSVPDTEVAGIARAAGLPFVNDLGSGSLVDLRKWGLPHETTVAEAIASGGDLVTFSGDKLLGGPQAGFIVGDRKLVQAIRSNPMKRALRVDKTTIAILVEILHLYRNPEQLVRELPTYRHLTRSETEIAARADHVAAVLKKALPKAAVRAVPCRSQIGSGSLPVDVLQSHGVELRPVEPGETALQALRQRLLDLPVPVIGRIQSGAILLDMRTLDTTEQFLEQFGSTT